MSIHDSGGFPPRSVPPANASMAKSFDKLVDSNLQLVSAVRLTLLMLALLTVASVSLTVYTTWNMKQTVLTILQQCKESR